MSRDIRTEARVRPAFTEAQATVLYAAANIVYSDPDEFTADERRELEAALGALLAAIEATER